MVYVVLMSNVEKAQQMKLSFEGYICAALFHGIFYIILSDFADDDNVKIPGTVKTPNYRSKILLIPTGRWSQRKLHRHTIDLSSMLLFPSFI